MMPYSGPGNPPAAPRIRNHHRRSHTWSDEKGPGAFVSLGALPKLQRKADPKKAPAFHFKDDDDDSPEDELHKHFPELYIDTRNLSPPRDERALVSHRSSSPPQDELAAPAAVPFPASSPRSPKLEDASHPTVSDPFRRPTLSRGSSHPILLSNGKPLKSSLKTKSSSASSIPDDACSKHLRVQSAPTTPFLSKNVHFPDKKEDGLESVRVFSLKARPASLGQGGDDTETDTEPEPSRFPFPRFAVNSSRPGRFPLAFDIDHESPGATTTIPTPNPPPYANIHFESITFVQSEGPSSPLAPPAPHLTGTILVRNVAYEKHVAVRFTLDEWQTTSEVRARYVASVPVLPWEKPNGRTLGDAVGMIASASNPTSTPMTWDRFSFNIRLEDHAYKLHDRVLWFVGRYTASGEGGGEWWDNNSGSNYRVGFKVAASKIGDGTGRTVSAPEPVMRTTAPEPTTRQDFGLGFEFPTSMTAPPSNGHALGQTIIPPSYPPTQTRFDPPPPSPRALPRQTKLSLLNYAAPSTSPTLPGPCSSHAPLNSPPPFTTTGAPNSFAVSNIRTTPPPSPKDEHSRKPMPPPVMPGMQTIIGGQPATSSFSEPRPKGITLQWPWGLGSNSHSNSRSVTVPGSRSTGSNSPQLHHSPQTMSSLSSTLVTPNSGSPQSRSGSPSPKSLNTDSDQLYNAFVQQWCFAQSPRPSPGQNGFSTGDGYLEGVLVG